MLLVIAWAHSSTLQIHIMAILVTAASVPPRPLQGTGNVAVGKAGPQIRSKITGLNRPSAAKPPARMIRVKSPLAKRHNGLSLLDPALCQGRAVKSQVLGRVQPMALGCSAETPWLDPLWNKHMGPPAWDHHANNKVVDP